MTPSLEQLAELVRQAEAKSRARKIEAETHQAAEQFRAAELRARQAVERLRALRPACLRALEQADADEQLLKELVRKLAQFKSSLESEAHAEQLISNSQAEIEHTRVQARSDLEAVDREMEEARRDLRGAIDQYRQLRRELDRLQPELAAQFSAEDRLLWHAEGHFPGGQLQLLAQDVEAGVGSFSTLGKHEQYAQLKVWIGRFRYCQATQDRDAELSESLQALSHRVFHQLKWLSRHYEPGYIEAFRHDYATDWAAYVAEAQEQLLQVLENGRRLREGDPLRPRDRPHEDATAEPTASTLGPQSHGVQPPPSGADSRSVTLDHLRRLIAHNPNSEAGIDRVLEALRAAARELGPDDPKLIQLAEPYRDHLAGDALFDALRRGLEPAGSPENLGDEKGGD
jgi:hypothetical protein